MSVARVGRDVLAARLVGGRGVEVGALGGGLHAAAERHRHAARPEAPQLPQRHVVVARARHAAALQLEVEIVIVIVT